MLNQAKQLQRTISQHHHYMQFNLEKGIVLKSQSAHWIP